MKAIAFTLLAGAGIVFSSFTNAPGKAGNKNAVSALAPAAAKTFVVNTGKSKLAWEAKKVTGQHNGLVNISKGQIALDKQKPVSGTFDIDMTSMTCTDLKDAGYNKKLMDHLKSDDFFSVEKHPTATFKASRFVPIANAKGNAANYNVTGDLTIKGITHSITFPATITTTGNEVKAVAEFTIDRSKWDVRYGSTSFFEGLGDKAIYNDIKFNLDMVATPAS